MSCKLWQELCEIDQDYAIMLRMMLALQANMLSKRAVLSVYIHHHRSMSTAFFTQC